MHRIILIASLITSGCLSDSEVLAEYNTASQKVLIKRADFRSAIAAMSTRLPDRFSIEAQERFLRQMATASLLAQEVKDPEIIDFSKECIPVITGAVLQKERMQREADDIPEKLYELSHILLKGISFRERRSGGLQPASEAELDRRSQEVMTMLSSGSSFADLARTLSEDEASRDRGGDRGTLTQDILTLPELLAVRELETKPLPAVSPPVQTIYGRQIFLLRSVKNGKREDLAKAIYAYEFAGKVQNAEIPEANARTEAERLAGLYWERVTDRRLRERIAALTLPAIKIRGDLAAIWDQYFPAYPAGLSHALNGLYLESPEPVLAQRILWEQRLFLAKYAQEKAVAAGQKGPDPENPARKALERAKFRIFREKLRPDLI